MRTNINLLYLIIIRGLDVPKLGGDRWFEHVDAPYQNDVGMCTVEPRQKRGHVFAIWQVMGL